MMGLLAITVQAAEGSNAEDETEREADGKEVDADQAVEDEEHVPEDLNGDTNGAAEDGDADDELEGSDTDANTTV